MDVLFSVQVVVNFSLFGKTLALINACNSLIDYLGIHKHWNEGFWSDQTDQTTELFWSMMGFCHGEFQTRYGHATNLLKRAVRI